MERKTGGFDVAFDLFNVDDFVAAKAFVYEEFGAINAIGGEAGVGGSFGEGNNVSAGAGGVVAVAILSANAFDVADVVAEQGDDEVQPIFTGNATFSDVFSA